MAASGYLAGFLRTFAWIWTSVYSLVLTSAHAGSPYTNSRSLPCDQRSWSVPGAGQSEFERVVPCAGGAH